MFFICIYQGIVLYLRYQTENNMKTSKNTTTYTKALSVVIPRRNGTPAQFTALAASILRGKELVK